MSYDQLAAVDEDLNFPPEVRQAIADATEIIAKIVATASPIVADAILGTRPIIPLTGLVANSSGAAAANGVILQAALNSAFYKEVYVPEGLFYSTALTIPANKELTGAYSRAYTTLPTTGTRLRAAAATATFITTVGRSKLTNIAVYGTGSTGTVVNVSGNGAVLRDCSIGGGNYGIDADYHLAIIDNVHIWGNNSDALRNVLDGKVYNCTINSNGGRGIYAGTGAGATQYIGNRIEWNTGAGMDLYETTNVTVMGNIIDRNGKSGIKAVNNTHLQIIGNSFWRNGKLSEGVTADDNQMYLQTNSHCIFNDNVTKRGGDDGGGGGYVSPVNAVRAQANDLCIVVGNDFAGGTVGYSQVTGAGDTNAIRHSNRYPAGEGDTFLGAAYLATTTSSAIAPAATGAIVLTNPIALSVNSTGRVIQVDISGRDSAGTARSMTVPIAIARPLSADATVTVGAMVQIQGTSFSLGAGGATLSVTFAVNADATAITVSIVNGLSNSWTFAVRVQ